jgi:hypothetical protein
MVMLQFALSRLTTTYSPNSGNRQDDAYNYDLTGNILQTISSKNGCGVGGTDSLIREFSYDPLYRAPAGGKSPLQLGIQHPLITNSVILFPNHPEKSYLYL